MGAAPGWAIAATKLAEQAKGNVSEIARRAGMERAHVRTYLKRHDIDVKQYR